MSARAEHIKRYSEVAGRYAVIHAGTHGGNDYTLCGAALDGEDGDSSMMGTRRRITCQECIRIIRYCKSIPARLVNAPAVASGTCGDAVHSPSRKSEGGT